MNAVVHIHENFEFQFQDHESNCESLKLKESLQYHTPFLIIFWSFKKYVHAE